MGSRMKLWRALSAFVGVSVLLVLGLLFLDARHQSIEAAEYEKVSLEQSIEYEREALELSIAQTATTLQAGISANQLQLMRWELDDINTRLAEGKPAPGDSSRKIVLEARIKALAVK